MRIPPTVYLPVLAGIFIAAKSSKRRRLPNLVLGAVLGYVGLRITDAVWQGVPTRYLPTIGSA